MAIDTKTMGSIQLIAGVIAVWGAWRSGIMEFEPAALGLGVLGLGFMFMGWHHIKAKGHKLF
jgi:hypothetical protein